MDLSSLSAGISQIIKRPQSDKLLNDSCRQRGLRSPKPSMRGRKRAERRLQRDLDQNIRCAVIDGLDSGRCRPLNGSSSTE
ncbi:hypothetical protein WA026_012814 [Henosepilachna vigintioctopunctata]|uniref:Uncharacterized protein n=1 Tax=Henosepilachna vigintioctopunctata TaxID=420089 RepID=A0AAW1TWA3_9CUCU